MYSSQLKDPPKTLGRRLMEEVEEFNEAVLASAGSGAALAGGRRLQRLTKKQKTKCSFPDLMGIFTDRWGYDCRACCAVRQAARCGLLPQPSCPNAPSPSPHSGAGAAGSSVSSLCLPLSAPSWTSAWGWMSVCQPSEW